MYQFEQIDVPDGQLETASIEEVNEKYDDQYLIGEAKHRLDLVEDQLEDYYYDPDNENFKIFSENSTMTKNDENERFHHHRIFAGCF